MSVRKFLFRLTPTLGVPASNGMAGSCCDERLPEMFIPAFRPHVGDADQGVDGSIPNVVQMMMRGDLWAVLLMFVAG